MSVKIVGALAAALLVVWVVLLQFNLRTIRSRPSRLPNLPLNEATAATATAPTDDLARRDACLTAAYAPSAENAAVREQLRSSGRLQSALRHVSRDHWV